MLQKSYANDFEMVRDFCNQEDLIEDEWARVNLTNEVIVRLGFDPFDPASRLKGLLKLMRLIQANMVELQSQLEAMCEEE